MKLSKKQFTDRVKTILSLSKTYVASIEKQRAVIEDQCESLAAHDPELAKLVLQADLAAVNAYNTLIKYISTRTEN